MRLNDLLEHIDNSWPKLYHGSNGQFNVYSTTKSRGDKYIYATTDPSVAKDYGRIVYQVVPQIKSSICDLTTPSDKTISIITQFLHRYSKTYRWSVDDLLKIVIAGRMFVKDEFGNLQGTLLKFCFFSGYTCVIINDQIGPNLNYLTGQPRDNRSWVFKRPSDVTLIPISSLTERKIQRTTTMWHGTSDIHLRSILKHGLLATPPKRTYAGDESDPDPDGGFETFGGVYISSSIGKARSAANDSVSRFGGKPILIMVQYVMGSGNIDEDTITQTIAQDIYHILTDYYEMPKEVPARDKEWHGWSSYFSENRDDIIDGLVDSALTHLQRYGKFGNPVASKMRKIFEYVLDNVDHDILYAGNLMSVLRDDPIFIRMVETIMRNIFPTNTNSLHAPDFNFQITRNIGFSGKTKIVAIETTNGVPIWENPTVR